jgi:hypothetical protein
MTFTDDLLFAISSWQKGWREDQEERHRISQELLHAIAGLDAHFKAVDSTCYRKRFLHQGELVDIIIGDDKREGVVSWTVNKAFAERFKGLERVDAVSGAIFEHKPASHEVVLNICSLWMDSCFVSAVEDFDRRHPDYARPLLNFRDQQGEVILNAPLKGSEIIALTGKSSPFDELCDCAGVAEGTRDDLFMRMVQSDIYAGELQYTSREGAQRVIANTVQRMHEWIHTAAQGGDPAKDA